MKNCLIMGSGRSGTSMLAGMLQQVGYQFGDNLYPPRQSNPKGFFENKRINEINNKILIEYKSIGITPNRGQRWLSSIPPEIHITNYDKSVEKEILSITEKKPYCIKDPRICYTLPVWKKFDNNNICICIFRNPAVTVKSILKECEDMEYLSDLKITKKIAYEIWFNMYSHIIKNFYKYNINLVHYDKILNGEKQEKLSNLLETTLDYHFVEKKLNRTMSNELAPIKIINLYKKLLKMAI